MKNSDVIRDLIRQVDRLDQFENPLTPTLNKEIRRVQVSGYELAGILCHDFDAETTPLAKMAIVKWCDSAIALMELLKVYTRL